MKKVMASKRYRVPTRGMRTLSIVLVWVAMVMFLSVRMYFHGLILDQQLGCLQAETYQDHQHEDNPEYNLPKPNIKTFSAASSRTSTDHAENFDTSPWCPIAHSAANSTCASSAQGKNHMCRPCQRRFLVILATGRSASTTLTWMLDTLPGIRMSGENNNLMGHLYDLHESTLQSLIMVPNPSKGAWYRNEVTESSVACMVQNVVETINPPPRSMSPMDTDEQDMILGFKTIRLLNEGRGSFEKASELIEHILKMLPCSRFVVNVRSDTNGQAISQQKGWKSTRNDTNAMNDFRTKLDKDNSILKRIANEVLGPKRAILLDSSQWTKNVTTLNKAVEWLGYTPECFFEELLEFNTKGDKGYGHNKKELKPHKSECRYKHSN